MKNSLPVILTLLLMLLLVACAGGKPAIFLDGFGGHDAGVMDWGLEPYPWPNPVDQGKGKKDVPSVFQDSSPPQDSFNPLPDQAMPKPCGDVYETNENCSWAKSMGTVKEGSSWVSKTATIDPAADVDWFSVIGEEGWHLCLPTTSQTYTFKVRVQVPAGRVLKVCVYAGSCSASGSCKDNQSKPGPFTLEVSYKVKGTCASNDDTTAKILVHSKNGKGGCPPYTVPFNYDD